MSRSRDGANVVMARHSWHNLTLEQLGSSIKTPRDSDFQGRMPKDARPRSTAFCTT